MEYRRKCNLCGHFWCYTDQDLKNNASNSAMSAISAIGGLASALGGGTIFHTAHLSNQTNRYSDKVIDYTKCPSCNSTNTVLVTEEDQKAEPEKVPVSSVRHIEINSSATPETLIKRAMIFLEDSDWVSANAYAEACLDIEPENPQAYLVKLMADVKVTSPDGLANCSTPFTDSANYLKVLRFGDEALAIKLKGYIDTINTRNETARVRGIYKNACGLMSKNQEESYLQAAELFKSIPDYKDSSQKAEECKEKAALARKEAVRLAKKAREEAAKKAEEERIAKEALAKEKKKKLIKTSVIAAVVLVAIIVLISVLNAGARKDITSKLVGKTVGGTYIYDCPYFTTKDYYEIYFIDENYCNIYVEWSTEYPSHSDYEDYYKEGTYENVPYKISGGIGGVKFNWDSNAGPYHSVKDFEVTDSAGTIKMYTSNFNSHTSMIMKEVEAKSNVSDLTPQKGN